MALTTCPDCGKQVSTAAQSCPNCGRPITADREVRAIGVPTTTTQATSKRLKAQQLIAGLLFAVGVVLTFVASSADANPTFWALLALIGLVWYITARFRTWWHHG